MGLNPKILYIAVLAVWCISPAFAATLKGVRMHEAPASTRVVFDADAKLSYSVFVLDNPHRVVVDLKNVADPGSFDPSVVAAGRKWVTGLRASKRPDGYRVVIDSSVPLKPEAFTLRPIEPYGHRLVVDLSLANQKPTPVVAEVPDENRDVIIAIDAGHGGEDPGAIGPRKIQEKRVVLQIARRVKKNLDAKPGVKAVLVRTGDYYLAHRQRTDIARRARADLFVSIHADAFKQASVHGASVYTLSDRGATSETAKWLH